MLVCDKSATSLHLYGGFVFISLRCSWLFLDPGLFGNKKKLLFTVVIIICFCVCFLHFFIEFVYFYWCIFRASVCMDLIQLISVIRC